MERASALKVDTIVVTDEDGKSQKIEVFTLHLRNSTGKHKQSIPG